MISGIGKGAEEMVWLEEAIRTEDNAENLGAHIAYAWPQTKI